MHLSLKSWDRAFGAVVPFTRWAQEIHIADAENRKDQVDLAAQTPTLKSTEVPSVAERAQE